MKKELARPERFELPTLWFEARCSIQLSYGRVRPSYQNLRVARGEVRRVEFRNRELAHAPERIARNAAARSTKIAAVMNNGEVLEESGKNWWAWVDLNYRPHPYQGCALAT